LDLVRLSPLIDRTSGGPEITTSNETVCLAAYYGGSAALPSPSTTRKVAHGGADFGDAETGKERSVCGIDWQRGIFGCDRPEAELASCGY